MSLFWDSFNIKIIRKIQSQENIIKQKKGNDIESLPLNY